MAANAPPELASGNPCCIAVRFFPELYIFIHSCVKRCCIYVIPFDCISQWQGKYLGMKKRRDACKEAIEILQKAMGAANDEKTNLQKSKLITFHQFIQIGKDS